MAIKVEHIYANTGTAMCVWNKMRFVISAKEATGITGFEINDSYNDDYNEKGKRVGRELATFRVNATYFTPVAGAWKDAREGMQRWRRHLGESAYIYIGGVKITDRKCRLMNVSVNDVSFTNKGKIIASKVQLEFRWVRTKAQEQEALKAAKESNNSSNGSSSKSSSKNSTAKSTTTTSKPKNGIIAKKPSPTQTWNGGKFKWPTPGYKRITSPYGWRTCPYHGREKHSGIDIGAPGGARIIAAAAGTVVLSGRNGSYGNCIIISHGRGVWTLYGHQSRLLVGRGAKVKAGQQIGKVGSTGNSTGNHLHFEVRKGANNWNNNTSPWKYL